MRRLPEFAHYDEYGGMKKGLNIGYLQAATCAFFTNLARLKFPYENRLVEISRESYNNMYASDALWSSSRFWTGLVQNWTGPVSDRFWTGASPCAAFLTNYVCGGEGCAALWQIAKHHAPAVTVGWINSQSVVGAAG